METRNIISKELYDVIIKFDTKSKEPWTPVPISLINNSKLSKKAKLLIILYSSNETGWKSYESDYARKMGVTEKTIRKYNKELIAEGFLNREEVPNSKQQRNTCYQYYIDIKGDAKSLLVESRDGEVQDVVRKFKTKDNKNWIAVPKRLLNDESLSIGAKILCMMYYSNKPNWKSKSKQYVDKLNVGRQKVHDYNRELTDSGYLFIRKIKAQYTEKGRIEHQYFVDIEGKKQFTESVFFPNSESAIFPNTESGNLPTNNTTHIIRSNSNNKKKEKRKKSSSSSSSSSNSTSQKLRTDFDQVKTEAEFIPNDDSYSTDESNFQQSALMAEAMEIERERRQETINLSYQHNIEPPKENTATETTTTPTATFNFLFEGEKQSQSNSINTVQQQFNNRNEAEHLITDEEIIQFFLSHNSTEEEARKFINYNNEHHSTQTYNWRKYFPDKVKAWYQQMGVSLEEPTIEIKRESSPENTKSDISYEALLQEYHDTLAMGLCAVPPNPALARTVNQEEQPEISNRSGFNYFSR